ncbi:porin [Methylosoma difficile]
MSRPLAVMTSLAAAMAFSGTSQAMSVEQRMALMEKRMAQLEDKLEKSESENRQLKSQLPSHTAPVTAATPTLKNMDDKIAVLEKRLDTEKKTADEAAKKAPKIEVSTKGMSYKSADENYKFSLRGYAQSDARFYFGDNDQNFNDNFNIRRVRISFDGTLFKNVDFRIAPDFAGSQARLFDAFIDAHYFSAASLMVGKFRQPVSLERMQSAPNLTFIERSFPAQLAPNRDLGVMLHGAFAYPGYKVQYTPQPVFKEFFSYELGVFNGIRDNQAAQNADGEGDNNKEIAGRLFAHPFMHSGSVLEGLGIGVSGTWGQPNGNTALPSLTSNGQQTIVSYNPTTRAIGESYRIYPQMYWYWKSFGMMGEYLLSTQTLQNTAGTLRGRQDNEAWHINFSYMLTGENNSFFGIKPEHVFDPKTGHWGAWQIATRYSELDIDPITSQFGTSVTRAQAWAIGLNWILNENFKIMNNFEQTYYVGGGFAGLANRPTENVFLSRFQIAF